MAINVNRMGLFQKNKKRVTIERIIKTDANDRPTADGIETIVAEKDILIRKQRTQVEQDGELVSLIEFKGYLSPPNPDIKRGHRVRILNEESEILEIVDITPNNGFQTLIMNSKEY